jgi:hypothetical protein
MVSCEIQKILLLAMLWFNNNILGIYLIKQNIIEKNQGKL